MLIINHSYAQEQKKISAKGSAMVQLRYYTITNKKPTARQPFVLNLNAQPVVSVGKWTVNTRFVIGNYQTQFRDFNRYGISPSYKWMRFYLGHNTLNWSQFALEGRPVLGAGFDLTPGKMHFGMYVGDINRAAVQDTFRGRVFSPTFLRQMLAIKIGYGNTQNFVDLVVFTGADKFSSLSSKQTNGITPASNGILALKFAKQLIQNVSFFGDIGFSAFTRNQNATGGEFGPSSPSKVPGNLIKTNSSTQNLGAYAAGLKYNKNKPKIGKLELGSASASLDFSRIEPGYQSMGLYFLVNDIQRLKMGLTLLSKNQKLQFDGNLGLEHNNILKTQFIKNKRVINGFNILYRPNNSWNYMVSLQNYAVKLLADVINANDSLLINQVNRNCNFSANGFLGDKNASFQQRSRVMFSLGYQSGKNIIASTTTKNLGHTYLQMMYSPPASSSQWRLSPGYSLHRYVFGAFGKVTTTRHIPSIGFDKNWQQGKYNLHIETGAILTWFQKKFTTLGWRNSLSGMWNMNRKSYLQGSLFAQPNLQKGNNFSEIQADIRYGIRF